MWKRILVALDKSAPATRALSVAVDLAMQLGGQIGVLHVVDTNDAFVAEIGYMNQEYLASLRKAGNELLLSTLAGVPRTIEVSRLIAEGDPSESILDMSNQWHADLIVIGSDSRGRLAHFLLGSTADAVIRKACCPVLSVRAEAAVREDADLQFNLKDALEPSF